MYKILCAIIAVVISLTAGIGLPIYKEETGESVTVSESGKISDDVIAFTFARQSVNTVELEFGSAAESVVTIYCDGNEVYRRQGAEEYRFCAFPTVECSEVRISVDGGVVAKSASVSLKQGKTDNFRVTSYFVAGNIQSAGSINPKVFDVVTDAIIFGCVTFDENADITVNFSLLGNALSNIRNAIGERDVNVYVNILGPGSDQGIADWYDQMDNQGRKHSRAFASGKLEGGIAKILDEYNLDGIFFDYEYPIDLRYWSDFSRFLVKLDKTTDKKIGIALAHWDIGLSYSAIKAVDMIELMQYDSFDASGNHSSFTSAVDGFEAARDYLLPRDKADLGVPFYGRPSDGGAYWPSYRDYADEMGRGCDYAQTEYGKSYFNSWQTVYDKTAYAISRGLGGMMVWHYSCDVYDIDSSLSLFGAMKECIDDRIG